MTVLRRSFINVRVHDPSCHSFRSEKPRENKARGSCHPLFIFNATTVSVSQSASGGNVDIGSANFPSDSGFTSLWIQGGQFGDGGSSFTATGGSPFYYLSAGQSIVAAGNSLTIVTGVGVLFNVP